MASSSNKTLQLQELKKAQKLRKFREYLCDSGVVLAMVKFLLALRQAEEPVANPAGYVQDFFGFYEDEKTQAMKDMEIEVAALKDSITANSAEIQTLKTELDLAKKTQEISGIFRNFEVEALPTRVLVQKLSGQQKFDVDLKLSLNMFTELAMGHFYIGDNAQEKDENWRRLVLPIQEISTPGADGKAKPPPFVGRLDDPSYLRLIEGIRAYAAK